MGDAFRRFIAALAGGLLVAWCGAAAAAEIKVVSVGALQVALPDIAADYMKQTGDTVSFTFTNPTNLPKVLAMGTFDVVIVAAPSVDELKEAGKLQADTQIPLARTGIGVAIKEGAPKPDLSTPESFKRAILASRNVVYTDPSTPTGSGILTQRILAQAGLLDAVRAKGRQEGLGAAKQLIASGAYELGLFNVSESTAPGVVLAGPVPAGLQQYTNYDAAVMKASAAKDRARGFIAFLAAPGTAAKWSAAGLERTAR